MQSTSTYSKHCWIIPCWLSLWPLVWDSDSLVAQTPWNALIAMASEEERHYQQPTSQDVQAAQARVAHHYKMLMTALATTSQATGWNRFLTSAKIKPVYSDDLEIEEVIRILKRDAEGMDWIRLLQYRESLENYLSRKVDFESKEFFAEFQKRSDKMHRSLLSYERNPSAQTWADISKETTWLLNHGQLPKLTQPLRNRSLSKNVHLQVSQKLLGAYVQSQFQEQRPVSDCILGATIVGNASAQGSSELHLLDNPNLIHLNIVIASTVRSDTIGYKGPVRIYSDGLTQIVTRKSIRFDGNTLLSDPAVSDATTNSSTKGIETKFSGLADRLVTKIAARQSNKKKSLGNSIAASHAARDTNRETDSKVEKMLLEGNRLFVDEVRRPWVIRGLFPKQIQLSSEARGIRMGATIATPHQLGAPSDLPSAKPFDDLSVDIHQSCINNLLSSYFSGKRWTSQDLRNLVVGMQKDESSSAIPPSSVSQPAPSVAQTPSRAPKAKELAITLDEETPLQCFFEARSLVLKICAKTIEYDGTSYSAMNITLRFQSRFEGDTWFLEFDGKPLIVPPRLEYDEKAKASGPEITLRRLLTNHIARDFPTSIPIQPYTLKREGEKIGILQTSLLDAEKGWLSLRAKYLPEKSH